MESKKIFQCGPVGSFTETFGMECLIRGSAAKLSEIKNKLN